MISQEDIPRRMIFLQQRIAIYSDKIQSMQDEIELIQAICEHDDTSNVAGNKRCQICGKELVA